MILRFFFSKPFQKNRGLMDDHLGVILLMDKNPAPVEGKVVHPIIYDGLGIHPFPVVGLGISEPSTVLK